MDDRTRTEIREKVVNVQGWLYPEAGEVLHDLAKQTPLPFAVELGSWKGLSTIWTACGLQGRVSDHGRGRLYAVDTWQGSVDEQIHADLIKETGGPDMLFEHFLANIVAAGLLLTVVPVRSTTDAALHRVEVPAQIGLLFIDASHQEDAVLSDYRSWSERVVSGGFVVFDDVPCWPGPTKIAREVAARELDFVAEHHNLWIGRKR